MRGPYRCEPVALVCTGALTNAALLVTLFPEIIPKIEVVLMGGCMGTGNTGSVAEFNIQVCCWSFLSYLAMRSYTNGSVPEVRSFQETNVSEGCPFVLARRIPLF